MGELPANSAEVKASMSDNVGYLGSSCGRGCDLEVKPALHEKGLAAVSISLQWKPE